VGQRGAVAGEAGNSAAMTADALHSLSDMATDAVASETVVSPGRVTV